MMRVKHHWSGEPTHDDESDWNGQEGERVLDGMRTLWLAMVSAVIRLAVVARVVMQRQS
jgi:hypothetical protein